MGLLLFPPLSLQDPPRSFPDSGVWAGPPALWLALPPGPEGQAVPILLPSHDRGPFLEFEATA